MITKCDLCSVGNRVDRIIRYHIDLDGELVVVDNVPAVVCDHCGETTFAPDVVDRLQKTIRGRGAVTARLIETRVYDFAA